MTRMRRDADLSESTTTDDTPEATTPETSDTPDPRRASSATELDTSGSFVAGEGGQHMEWDPRFMAMIPMDETRGSPEVPGPTPSQLGPYEDVSEMPIDDFSSESGDESGDETGDESGDESDGETQDASKETDEPESE